MMRIGVAVRAGISPGLHTALVRLAERCEVVALSDGGPFDAVVVTAPASTPFRTLLWVEEADQELPLGPTAYLAAPATARGLRRRTDIPVVSFGPQATHTNAVPIAPFTRARIRRARGLAEFPILRVSGDLWMWDERVIGVDAADTACALAAAVVVDSVDAAAHAAAWAAPVVAPPEVAAVLAIPLLAANPDAALEVLHDEATAARHSLACRAMFERDLDPDRAVVRLAQVVGARPRRPWQTAYSEALDLLGSSDTWAVRARSWGAVRELRSHR